MPSTSGMKHSNSWSLTAFVIEPELFLEPQPALAPERLLMLQTDAFAVRTFGLVYSPGAW